MSADNYMLIRKYRGMYSVTNESASVDVPTPVGHGRMFKAIGPAYRWANEEYSEYGVRLSAPCQQEFNGLLR